MIFSMFRILGTTTLGVITALAIRSRNAPLPPQARMAMAALLGMGWMQVLSFKIM